MLFCTFSKNVELILVSLSTCLCVFPQGEVMEFIDEFLDEE